MTIDYQIQLIPFPKGKVHESVTHNEDGSFTIFIDETLTRAQQKKHCLHALRHIIGDDFHKYSVDEIEGIAHEVELSEELLVEAV